MTVKPKIGVLLINVGTPASPKVSDVRKFLSEFLNDPLVIDLPWLMRKLLVNCIIVPFRAPKSAKIYEQVWTENGSPLLFHSKNFGEKLQKQLGADYQVEIAMRYQKPSIKEGLQKLRKHDPEKIIVVPMYPQYASSTTGTSIKEVKRVVSDVATDMVYMDQFYNMDGFIEAFVNRGKQYDLNSYDHILFSYHGLPVRHLNKGHGTGTCNDFNCEKGVTAQNGKCYKATCFETSRQIAAGLGLSQDQYTTSFQSRLDKDWMEPFSDKVIEQKAKSGAKKILVFSPAFVVDCLETVVEVGMEYQELFEEFGGEKIELVESLNDNPFWVSAMADHIRSQ